MHTECVQNVLFTNDERDKPTFRKSFKDLKKQIYVKTIKWEKKKKKKKV